jgi:hypothetical protein
MHDVVLSKAMFIIFKKNNVVANANKVTIVNVQQWINIHIFLMKNWQHVPILLTFKKIEVGATLNNIKTMILDAMGTYMVFLDDMASKWICLRCDGDSML